MSHAVNTSPSYTHSELQRLVCVVIVADQKWQEEDILVLDRICSGLFQKKRDLPADGCQYRLTIRFGQVDLLMELHRLIQSANINTIRFETNIMPEGGIESEKPKEVTSRHEMRVVAGFPRFWDLFPILLPRSLRERVYDPCHEELKEDYLKERGRWRTKWARRWVTFAFTFRTGLLVGQCCWAGLSASAKKAFLAFVGLVFGEKVVTLLRDKLCEWLGRLL